MHVVCFCSFWVCFPMCALVPQRKMVTSIGRAHSLGRAGSNYIFTRRGMQSHRRAKPRNVVFMFCKFPGISYYVGHCFLVELNPLEPLLIFKGCPAVHRLNIGFYIQRQCYKALRFGSVVCRRAAFGDIVPHARNTYTLSCHLCLHFLGQGGVATIAIACAIQISAFGNSQAQAHRITQATLRCSLVADAIIVTVIT